GNDHCDQRNLSISQCGVEQIVQSLASRGNVTGVARPDEGIDRCWTKIVLRNPGRIAQQEQTWSIGPIDEHPGVSRSMSRQRDQYYRAIPKDVKAGTKPLICKYHAIKELYWIITQHTLTELTTRINQN